MIKALRTIMPGDPGTKTETVKYGDRLICVRYRIDPMTLKKYKTAELIEKVIPPKNRTFKKILKNKILDIKIGYEEIHLRKVIKAAGDKWDVENKTWKIAYGEIKSLGPEQRIVFAIKKQTIYITTNSHPQHCIIRWLI